MDKSAAIIAWNYAKVTKFSHLLTYWRNMKKLLNAGLCKIKNLFKRILILISIFVACVNVGAQEYSFQKVDGCVNLNPFGQKRDCKTDFFEVIYPRGVLYYLVGNFGLDTPYKKFSELCDSKIKTFRIQGEVDFICKDKEDKWVSVVTYGKNKDLKLIYVDYISHYTCSNMNNQEILDKLINAFGDPVKTRSGRADFRYFDIDNGYQYVTASQNFRSDANAILNCPGEAVLEIKIDNSWIPTLKGKKYGLSAIFHDFNATLLKRASEKNVKF